MLDKTLLDILACPICKGKVEYIKHTGELLCKNDRLAFPIRNEIPVMLQTEARDTSNDADIIT